MTRCLILIDLQNDFVSGGALSVPRGNEVVEIANRIQGRFDSVVATQDWHPADHGSFAANHAERKPGDLIELTGLEQILWPVHCVQHTTGADFVPGLDRSRVERVFRKGTDPGIDSYSGFFDNGRRKATGLGDYLSDCGVNELFLVGLATDYCVKFSALDARSLGFATHLVVDGCRAVELQDGDGAAAILEMQRAGVRTLSSDEIT